MNKTLSIWLCIHFDNNLRHIVILLHVRLVMLKTIVLGKIILKPAPSLQDPYVLTTYVLIYLT